MPVEDSEDGDRRGGVTDPFGHVWYIGTHIEASPANSRNGTTPWQAGSRP